MKYDEHVHHPITKIMTEHAYRNLRKVQAIFRLTEKYGHEAVDQTCQRCLYYGDLRISTLKRILQMGLYHLPFEEEPVNTIWTDSIFTRNPEYFKHTIEYKMCMCV